MSPSESPQPHEDNFAGKDAVDAIMHILSVPARRARVEQLIFSICGKDVQMYVRVSDADVLIAGEDAPLTFKKDDPADDDTAELDPVK